MRIDAQLIHDMVDRENEVRRFSGVVLLKEDGEIKYEGAYGFSNRSEMIQNRIDTRFATASGCKTFTAVAICQLVDRGLIRFDTKLTECLPGVFPNFSPEVTVGQLLSHSSGIPDYFDEAVMDDFEALWRDFPMYRLISPKDFLPLFKDKDMMFTPGDHFHYNNAGFVVLGMIVEQLTSMAFPDYIRQHVFEPCGMKDSGYYYMDRLPERTALGYIDLEDGTWKANIYSVPVLGGPDGGAFITAEDMAAFWDALMGYKLFSKEITLEMLKPHVQVEGPEFYGYGIWMRRCKDAYQYYAIGSDPGVSFMSLNFPRENLQYTVVSNTNDGAWRINDGLRQVLGLDDLE